MQNKASFFKLCLTCAILCALSFTTAFLLQHALVDDSFIYLRVAENLVNGHSWSFNPDQVVNPCTSLLHPLLLAVLLKLGVAAEQALLLLYGAGLSLVSCAIFLMLYSVNFYFALALGLLALFEPALLHSIGMESSIFLGLVAIACLSFSKKRLTITGISVALAILCRIDALALLLILIIASYFEFGRRNTILLMLTTLSIVCAAAAFHYLCFASLLPQSIAVKQIQSTMSWFEDQPSWIHAWFLQRVGFGIFTPFALPFFLLAFRSSNLALRSLWLIAIFGLVQGFVYALSRAPSSYFWYFVPLNLSLNIAEFVGALYLLQRLMLGKWSAKLESIFTHREFAFGALILNGFLLLYGAAVIASRPIYLNSLSYRKIAQYLTSQSTPSEKLACTEIGYLGYFSKLNILDIHGLIHPEALPELRSGNLEWWVKQEPMWIVLHTPAWIGEPQAQNWSAENFAKFTNEYKQVFASGDVLLYAKQVN